MGTDINVRIVGRKNYQLQPNDTTYKVIDLYCRNVNGNKRRVHFPFDRCSAAFDVLDGNYSYLTGDNKVDIVCRERWRILKNNVENYDSLVSPFDYFTPETDEQKKKAFELMQQDDLLSVCYTDNFKSWEEFPWDQYESCNYSHSYITVKDLERLIEAHKKELDKRRKSGCCNTDENDMSFEDIEDIESVIYFFERLLKFTKNVLYIDEAANDLSMLEYDYENSVILYWFDN